MTGITQIVCRQRIGCTACAHAGIRGAGDTNEPIPLDLDGNLRRVDDLDTTDCPQPGASCGNPPVIDMGAYEFQCGAPIGEDCNANGVSDICDIGTNTSDDCNGNIVPDECDLADGTSPDVNGSGIPDECECLADINGDGGVDIVDFLQLLTSWGPCEPGCFGDVDFDGNVGILDFLSLVGAWGPFP